MRMTMEKARIAHCRARIFVLEQKLIKSEFLSLEEVVDFGNEINILENRIECAQGQIKARVRLEMTKKQFISSKINELNFQEL